MKTVEFLGEKCELEVRQYANKVPAIQLFCSEGPMATATINLAERLPQKNQLFIKDYLENEGMAKAFEKAGLAIEVGRTDAGHALGGIAIMEITDPELRSACYPNIERKPPAPKAKEQGPDLDI